MLRRSPVVYVAKSVPRSPWEVLQVKEGASKDEIKVAYRRLAKLYHPDVNPDGKKLFVELQDAYDEARSFVRRPSPGSRAAYKEAEEWVQKEKAARAPAQRTWKQRVDLQMGEIRRSIRNIPNSFRIFVGNEKQALREVIMWAIAITCSVAAMAGLICFVDLVAVAGTHANHSQMLGILSQKYVNTPQTEFERMMSIREEKLRRQMQEAAEEAAEDERNEISRELDAIQLALAQKAAESSVE
eukprot:TRINITY_DN38789_c0_g1_i1.p1 TRINITY_DN38789_c0_g1~~TRINITY_DN38789_c0_g1_i1.p1  ORF type:complete len:242 (+),score=85.25 TRINITY_DN38789_c0_g1_i1:59-784(+)